MNKIQGIILTLILILTLTACGNSKSKATGDYANKQEINWTESSTLSTGDLDKATDTLSFNVLLNTQEGLYRLNKNGVPKNALALKTKISKDGRQYTFDLRHNTKWSNNDPVTAQDFVYSWQRILNPKTASQDAFYLYQIVNAKAINYGKKPLKSLGIKAINKYKLQVNLVKPVSYFKKLLAWPLFFSINKNAVEKFGSKYGTQSKYIVSNGPFKLSNWTGTNDEWSLVKNNKYWDQKNVHLNKINELVTKDANTGYNLYLSNKVDETLLNGEQVKNNLKNKDFVKRVPTATSRLDLNQKKIKAFRNINIRKAISLAINRYALANDVLQNGSLPSKGFVPSNMGNNPRNGKPFDEASYVNSGVSYNLNTAKKLLEKGFKEAKINHLKFNILSADTDESRNVVEFLQTSLNKLPGVSVNTSTIPFVQLISRQDSSNYDATIKSWQSVFSDPINFLDIYESNSSYNNSGFNNKKYDNLLYDSENKYSNNVVKRWNNLLSAEKTLINNQGTIPLYQVAKPQLLRSNIKGIVYNPSGVPYDFKTAYVLSK